MQVQKTCIEKIGSFPIWLTKGVAVGLMLGVASCGSGSGSGSTTTYSVGGIVSGLTNGASIVLQNNDTVRALAMGASINGTDSVTITANGPFKYPTEVSDSSPYDISIDSPPLGEECAIIYGNDRVRSDDVTHIKVFCGPVPTGNWTTAADMGIVRSYHTATSLTNGKVLVAAGLSIPALLAGGDFIQKSSELYEPASNTWSPAGSLATARYYHTATLLPNGKVLVTGGYNAVTPIASSELYDPETDSWSSAGDMSVARLYHTATLLRNGKVLVVGGDDVAEVFATAEIYDPATNSWSVAASLATARTLHSSTLLANGKVLVAGGTTGTPALASAELYDPESDTWSATGSLATKRGNHSANLLPSGKVLVAGGFQEGGYYGTTSLASAEIYDPALGTWSQAGSMSVARSGHASITTLLPTSMVMVTGGIGVGADGNQTAYTSTDLYDPETNAWSATGNLPYARRGHTATYMSNGRIMVVGGDGNDATVPMTTEIY